MTRVSPRQAAEIIRRGGVVVIPTDTAYGLAADATNPQAIARVKALKGRARSKPIALIAADLAQVRHFFHLAVAEATLARHYWPGPLTLLLKPKRKQLAARSLSRTNLVGVRVPALAVPRHLARLVGRPLTATSANRAGKPPCYTIREAIRSLGRDLPVLDAGRLPRKPVSTVARVSRGRLRILRPGPIKPNAEGS